MSKKTIIACIAVLAVLAVTVTVSVVFLYSGTERTQASSLASDSDTGLLSAVPSDAVAVVEFEDLKTACRMLTDSVGCFHYFSGSASGGSVVSFLKSAYSAGLGALKSSAAVLSLHYNGALVPLLIIDAGRAGASVSEETVSFIERASASGLSALLVDGSSKGNGKAYVFRRNILLVSTSEVFAKSSERHMAKSVSVLDADGFASCAAASSPGNRIFLSSSQMGKLFTGLMNRSTYAYAEFLKNYAGWTVFSIDENIENSLSFTGISSCDEGPEDFLNVFSRYSPSKSQVFGVIPYYTAFFATLPFSDVNSFVSSLDLFWDASGKLDKMQTGRESVKKSCGISPLQWATMLDIKELSKASFNVDNSMESVLLIKTGSNDLDKVYKNAEKGAGRKSGMKMYDNPYQGIASALFGPYFKLEDESFCTFVDGWIVVGSKVAVSEYVSGRALENRLSEYMNDASLQSLPSGKDQYFCAYCSVLDAIAELKNFMKPGLASSFGALAKGYSFVPVVMTVSEDKTGIYARLTVDRASIVKSKAPVFERDTVVIVPKGPFKVKNSGTGETNLFYQQDNNYLCLKTEGGKGLWGVPFQSAICGNAETIDYFANGKLQILFASGSSLYLIDRLGRYVRPFPVKLGKEVLLGPGVYDFNNSRRYNVIILHTDNTIEMYNLQGKRPPQWKTITSKETIKSLPELIKVGGRSYWVVRTSMQTLIFGFYGGEPLTVFEGEKMIRPDSKVTPADGSSVSVVCYDGKRHTVKL